MFSEAIASRRRQRGLTLVELIMFIVIVSIALAGIVAVIRLTTAHSADPLRRKQALMIAEGLLEEVRSAGFTLCDPSSADFDTQLDPTQCAVPENWGQGAPEPANPRPFDNVNDYVARPNTATFAFNNAANRLADVSGQAMGLNGYTASVTLIPDTVNGAGAFNDALDAPANTDVLRIRIRVDFGGDAPVVLDGYRMRYARPGFQ
ncbi:MAG: type II secretion system protein [Pseudomonadota bacterium]